VYFEDTDAGGVAYHARYLHWAERARTEALRGMGLPMPRCSRLHGCFLVVRRLAVEYARPARLDDLVEVSTEIRRRRRRPSLAQEVRRGAEHSPRWTSPWPAWTPPRSPRAACPSPGWARSKP
jgi:acyl-CoA thioester hydrolase